MGGEQEVRPAEGADEEGPALLVIGPIPFFFRAWQREPARARLVGMIAAGVLVLILTLALTGP